MFNVALRPQKPTIWDGREAHLDFHNSSWSPQSAEAVNGWGGREQSVCVGVGWLRRHTDVGASCTFNRSCVRVDTSPLSLPLRHGVYSLASAGQADARLAETANKRRRHWVNRGQRRVHKGRGRSGVSQWASLTVTQADVEMTHLLPLYPHPTCSAQAPSASWRPLAPHPPPVLPRQVEQLWPNRFRVYCPTHIILAVNPCTESIYVPLHIWVVNATRFFRERE